ncbi:hypothetical protein PG996_010550 [Apiospora saccharicola]|uniref:SprT-like domain-containing protein n=1 Tax=Apiospora saccharicola TaxID=335842 RepID=A0ABR1URE1_9PEZI
MATRSTVDPNAYVDPATYHLGVTVNTRPEHWRRNAYKVSTIRDVLLQHLENLDTSPSAPQQQALNRLANHVRLDALPGMENRVIDWFAETGQISNDLDTVFFHGLVNKDWQTVYYPKPGGIDFPTNGGRGGAWAVTQWDNPGSMRIEIHFDTLDSDTEWRLTRLQRRSRVLGILCHEMIHALFMLYGCQSPACCLAQGGDYSLLLGADGYAHGQAWDDVAKAINALLVEKLPTLQYPYTLAFIYTRGTQGRADKTTLDALGIVEATDFAYAEAVQRQRARQAVQQQQNHQP